MFSPQKRAIKRSGLSGSHFHDIRGKALADTDEMSGIIATQRMGDTLPNNKSVIMLGSKKPEIFQLEGRQM